MNLKIRVRAWGTTALVIALSFLLAVIGYLDPEARLLAGVGVLIFIIGSIIVFVCYASRAVRIK